MHGFAVPLTSGAPRTLADPGGFTAGVDATGAYFYRIAQPSDPSAEKYDLVRAPADGGALETFLTFPDRVLPHRVWPDNQGGWVVASLGTFDDGKYHEAIWLVNAAGESRLAACDPVPGDDTAYVLARPAFSNDAVYLVAQNVQKSSWSVVKVAR